MDPHEAIVEVSLSPGCEKQALDLIHSLRQKEHLKIKGFSQNNSVLSEDADLKSRFAIITMGCQMNVYDSDYAAQCLVRSGYTSTENPEDADLIIVNTCSVREKAEHKAFSTLGRYGGHQTQEPELHFGFCRLCGSAGGE